MQALDVDHVGKAHELPLVIKGLEIGVLKVAFEDQPGPLFPLIGRKGAHVKLLDFLVVS